MDKTAFFRSPLVHFFLIVAIALVCYSNTFDVPFQFDDYRFIQKNPLMKTIDNFTDYSKFDGLNLREDVKRYFRTRQVGYLTLWANYKLGGMDVTGYHIANLVFHIVNALLLYLIVILTFKTPALSGSRYGGRSIYIALFSGLLFAAHPLQTEAVTYVLSRFVLLTAMFYLLSIVLYIKFRLRISRPSTQPPPLKRWGGSSGSLLLYFAALLSAMLAMKTKENAFTLPLAIALYEFMFFRGSIKKRAVHLVPFLLTMLIIPLAYMNLNTDVEGLEVALDIATRRAHDSRLDYLFTQFGVVVSYIKLLFFPVGQNVDHDRQVYHSFLEPQAFLSFLFLLGVLGLGVYLLRRSRITDHGLRLASFGVFWFFLALSVESSVLPITEMMVEYRVYLPSVGFFLAAVTAGFVLFDRVESPGMRKAALIAITLAVLAFSSAAYARNTVWRSKISLWEDVVGKSPNKARSYLSLGKVYESEGMLSKALKSYHTALRLKPDYAKVHHNLGGLYQRRGETGKALVHYRASVKLNPGLARAHNNLGLVYKSMGQYDKAIEHLREALKLTPSNTTIRINLGVVYRLAGLMDKAIEHLETVLKSEPNNAMIHLNLSAAYQSKGMAKKAAEHFRMANRGASPP